jgi:hypothetical protein
MHQELEQTARQGIHANVSCIVSVILDFWLSSPPLVAMLQATDLQ